MRLLTLVILNCLIIYNSAALHAGEGHEVTSTDGKTTKTYMVRFGGGKLNDMATAFDPASQKFVYLSWKRGTEMPKPVGSIWLAASGETLPLYKFPKVETPLPIIASVKELKVCPYTGDKNLKTELKMFID